MFSIILLLRFEKLILLLRILFENIVFYFINNFIIIDSIISTFNFLFNIFYISFPLIIMFLRILFFLFKFSKIIVIFTIFYHDLNIVSIIINFNITNFSNIILFIFLFLINLKLLTKSLSLICFIT